MGASRGRGGAQPLNSSARATLDCSATVGQRVPTLRVRTHLGDGLRGFEWPPPGPHQPCGGPVRRIHSTKGPAGGPPFTCVCAHARTRACWAPCGRHRSPSKNTYLLHFGNASKVHTRARADLHASKGERKRPHACVWRWRRGWGCGKGWREGEPFSGKDSWVSHPPPHLQNVERTRLISGTGGQQEGRREKGSPLHKVRPPLPQPGCSWEVGRAGEQNTFLP